MKKLMLATVSAVALGLAGVGVGQAAEPANTAANPPATSTQTGPEAQQQATPGTQQQATPGTQQEATEGAQQQTAPVRLSRTQVEQVQKQLKSAGVYQGRIDGKMGRETKEALKDFQQKNGLQSTGTLDQQTMAALQQNQQNQVQGSGGSAMAPGTTPGATPQNGEAAGSEGNAAQGNAAQGNAALQQQTPSQTPNYTKP